MNSRLLARWMCNEIGGGGGCTLPCYLDYVAYSYCLVVMCVLLYEFPKAWVGEVLEVRHGWFPTVNAILDFACTQVYTIYYAYVDNTTRPLKLDNAFICEHSRLPRP